MPQLVELKQNRDFIEPSFPGYKLSLQEIPKFSLNLNSNVHVVHPTNEQYSYKHAKLFNLHNFLLAMDNDKLEGTEMIYYITQDRMVYQMRLDILGLEEICMNWKVPQINPKQDYNFTMALVNFKLAIVSDGCGSIYLIDRSNEWKCIFSDTHQFSFVIIDCKLVDEILHVLLFNVKSETAETAKHKSMLHWVQYECVESTWKQKNLQEMESPSELHHALIANDAVYLLSTEGGFARQQDDETQDKMAAKFTWSQTNDTICIFIKATEIYAKHNYITIKNGPNVVVEGPMFGTIDETVTTWTMNNGVMEIILSKVYSHIWPELIKGQPSFGECLPDDKTAKEVHAKLAHLCSENEDEAVPTKTSTITDQVEECDFISSKGCLLERITSYLNVSHRIILTQEVIFVDNETQSFAIQQNEDVCLYKPIVADGSTVSWSLEHFGTLFALGYIRASKQRRKFTTCAPDLSYSIVAESSRHIFVYRQFVDVISGELRNRTSGTRIKQLAQQQVIELCKDEDVLGIRATNSTLFVLTENTVYAFKMK